MDIRSVSPCSPGKENFVNHLSATPSSGLLGSRRLPLKARRGLVGPTGKNNRLGQIIKLNEVGVSESKKSNFSGALRCFTHGLDQLLAISDPALASTIQKSLLCSTQSSQLEVLLSDHFDAQLSTRQFTELQDYDEGMNYFLSYMEDLEDSLNGYMGADAVTSALLYNIGQVFVRQEHYSDAHNCFLEAWCLSQSALPSVHSFHIRCLYNAGCSEYRQGNNEGAMTIFSNAFGILRELKPSKITSRTMSSDCLLAPVLNCLGVLFYHSSDGDESKALTYLSQALSVGTSSNSHDLRFHATVMNNLGRASFVGLKYEEAVNCYQKALSIRRSILGDDHVDVAATYCNLAQTFHRLGELDAAFENYKEFLRITLPKFGQFHQDVSFARKCIASIHYERGEKKQALDMYKDVIASRIHCLGYHPEVATIYSRMGKIYFDLGDYDAAFNMYTRGLHIELLVLDRNHPNIITTLSNIAQICRLFGDLKTAINVYTHVLSYQARALGFCHADVAATLSKMGLVNYHGGNYWYALDLHLEALRIRRTLFGEDNLEVAGSLNSIGLIFFKLSSYNDALDNFVKCLRIREEILGRTHHDVAIVLYNIAASKLELGDDDSALSCYHESQRIEEMTLGPVHKDVILPLECIADIYQRRGELSKALDHCSQILKIQECGIPLDRTAIAKTLNKMANLNLQLGRAGEAVKFIVDAARIVQNCECANVEIGLTGFDLYACAKLYPEGSPAA